MTLDATVLLTGATGFVGRMVLRDLLESTQATVIALVRAPDDGRANARLARALDESVAPSARRRLASRAVAMAADLERPNLGLSPYAGDILAEEATHIVHAAASVRFDLPLARARRINVEGTRSVVALARAAQARGRLQRLVSVGTAFVAGTYAGRFGEAQLDVGQGFRNTYECSKFEAEMLLRDAMGDVPISIVRPSIVMGHSVTGATTSFNVLYVPIRLYVSGRVRRVPVRARLPLDVVPVDFVARVVREAALGCGRDGATYAAVAGRRATTAAEVAEVAAEVFGIARPRLLRAPLPPRAIGGLARLQVCRQPRARRAAMRVYLPYLVHGSRFDSSNTEALLRDTGVTIPDSRVYLQRVMEFARATRFGGDAPAPIPRPAPAPAGQRVAVNAGMRPS